MTVGDRVLTILIFGALGYFIYHKVKYGTLLELSLKNINFKEMFGGKK